MPIPTRAPLRNIAAATALAALPVLALNPATSVAAQYTFAAAVASLFLASAYSLPAVRRAGEALTMILAFPSGVTLSASWVFAIMQWHLFNPAVTTDPLQWAFVVLIAVVAAGSIALNVTARPDDDNELELSPFAGHPAFATHRAPLAPLTPVPMSHR